MIKYNKPSMLKKLTPFLFTFFLCLNVHADDASEKISGYISNLIPGEGDTEVSIDLRDNHSADFSILAVRELSKINSGNIFTQISLFNTEKNSEDRIIGNFGLGSRKLLYDDTLLAGVNAFIDNDFNETTRRMSLGFELKNAVLDFSSNIYEGIEDSQDERVMNGWDYTLASQVPYVHWSKIFVSQYQWEGILREDVEGIKLGSEMLLTPHVNLEVAYDDKDRNGLEDEWYAKIQLVHPPRNNGPTALDGISDTAWNKNKDMSDELLSKVKRNNKIMVEFKGSSTISRTD
jgi:hypothetical protein